MTTIEWVDGHIRILDQTRLPAEELVIDGADVDERRGDRRRVICGRADIRALNPRPTIEDLSRRSS